MKNILEWKPSKIICRDEKFYVNSYGVSPSSIYITKEAFRVTDSYKIYLKGHLVDLGCGNVPYYQWYKDRVDNITCIDWEDTTHSQNYVDIFCDLNNNLALESNSVDTIFTTSVLEHICEPKNLIQEMARILKKDGYIILTVPFFYHLHEQPYDFFRYTPYGIRYLAETSGLSVVESNHYGSAFGVLVDITAKIFHVFISVTGNMINGYVGRVIVKLLVFPLIYFQLVMFWILRQKSVLYVLKKMSLSSTIALGYSFVLTKKDK